MMVRVYDLRGEWTGPHPKGRTRGGSTVERNPALVDAIVLHQAAVDFADRGDEPATARRAMRAACHAMAFEGCVSIAAPLRWHVHHANDLNARSLGIEVDGLYPGRAGGRVVKGRTATPLRDETVEAAREAVRLLVELGRAEGMPIRLVYAHRQADSWRRADPGEQLWRRVVLEYAVPVLGLETRPAERFDNVKGPSRRGLPVPLDWDPGGVGCY